MSYRARVGLILQLGLPSLLALSAACHEGGRDAERDAETEPASAMDAGRDAEVDAEAPLADALAAREDAASADARVRGTDAQASDAASGSSRCADPAHCAWLELAVLHDESCAVREDHTLWCWGLGKQAPEQIELRGGVSHMSSSAGNTSTTCLINALGDLMCRDQTHFAAIGAPRVFEQVATADFVGCALLKGGKLSCWPLRDGFPERGINAEATPGLEALVGVQVAVSDVYACAVDDQQRLWCWESLPPPRGASDAGTASDAGGDASQPSDASASGDAAVPTPAMPRQLDPTQRYSQIAISRRELCAIRASGELVCWPNVGPIYQLFDQQARVRSPELRFRSLAVSDPHSCAIATDGSLWCWGSGNAGQLGNGSLQNSSLSVRVGDGNQWVEVRASVAHTCARDAQQQIWCWGDNLQNAIGTVTTGFMATPRELAPDRRFAQVSVTALGGCAVSSAGELWCWGEPDSPALPAGTGATPARIGSFSDWRYVMLRSSVGCGLRGAGAAWCWGDSYGGKLGATSDAGVASTPRDVQPGSSFQRLYSDGYTLCGIAAGGALRCWGQNNVGTFGDGKTSSAAPVNVEPQRSFLSLAFTRSNTLGVTSDGALWEWVSGTPFSQRGSGFTDVQAALSASCALKSSGELWCWGVSSVGQLGSSESSIASPTQVQTSERFTSLTLVQDRTCALTAEGKLWCMGSLYNLTSRDYATRASSPVAVLPERQFKQISHDLSGACAIQLDSALVCWGDSAQRRLGSDERYVSRPKRVPLP